MALSSMAVAQEIGTEITPVTPGSSNTTQPVNQPNDNPYATQPKEGDKPAEQKGAPKKEGTEGQASAGKGAFGLRATFGGQGIGLAGRGVAAAPVPTGTVGFSYWGSDAFTLLFDLGFGMGISGGGVLLGFGATVGMDYHFRTPADGLRPLIHVQVGIGSAIASDIGNALELSAQVGGGAEYFFSPSFSISGRLGLGLRLPFASGSMTLTTFTPAAGAAWYF
jgi:hypothetical protein